MKKIHFYYHLILALGILALISNQASGQESFVKVWGAVYNMAKQPMKNATVTLFQDNNKTKTVTTNRRGEFTLQLPHSRNYTIEAGKPGYCTKKARFSTKVPQKDIRGFMWEYELSFTLFEDIEGLDKAPLNDPVVSIQYYAGDEDFDFDAQYTAQMDKKLDAMLQQLAELKQAKFDKEMIKADGLFSNSKLEEAWLTYDNALELVPKNKEAKKKINEIKKLLFKGKSEDKTFRDFMLKADAFMVQKNYEEAMKMYKLATLIKPESATADTKLAEAEKLKLENPTTTTTASTDVLASTDNVENLDMSNSEIKTETMQIIAFDDKKIKRSIDSCKNVLAIKEKSGDKKGAIAVLNKMAEFYVNLGDFDSANETYDRALLLSQAIGDKVAMSKTLNNLGVLSDNAANLDKAVKYFEKSLEVNKDLKDNPGMSKMYYRLGRVYQKKKELGKALECFQKSLEIDKKLKDEKAIATSETFIGNVYFDMKQYDKANDFYQNALKVYEKLNSQKDIAVLYNNLGNLYSEQRNFNKAIEFYQHSVQLKEKAKNKAGVSITLHNMGNVYLKMKNYDQALKSFNNSLRIAKSTKDIEVSCKNYLSLHEVMIAKGNYQKALEYYKQYTNAVQFMNGPVSAGQITEFQFKYDEDKIKVGSELTMLKGELAKQRLYNQAIAMKNEMTLQTKNAELTKLDAENKQKKLVMYGLIGGISIILLFLIFLWRSNRKLKKANVLLSEHEKVIESQKLEIEQQRDFVIKQGDRIAAQNAKIKEQRDQLALHLKEMEDSIHFAKYIQSALLLTEDNVMNALPPHFMYWKPKNVVSGDFYWVKQISFADNGKLNNKFIIVAADCTGPGVPGAVMSMLGVALLNEIINKIIESQSWEMLQSNILLNQLRDKFNKSLHLSGKEGETKDGMDVSLCILDMDEMKLQYSGANQPMYIIHRSDEGNAAQFTLKEFKPDKISIGLWENTARPYTKFEVDLLKGDTIYIFSDGFYDQFGGPRGKKYMVKQFKQTLINIQDKAMHEQHHALAKIFDDWKGGYEQVDDVLVIGFRI